MLFLAGLENGLSHLRGGRVNLNLARDRTVARGVLFAQPVWPRRGHIVPFKPERETEE